MTAHPHLTENQASRLQSKPGTKTHNSFLKGAQPEQEHEELFISHREEMTRPEIQVQILVTAFISVAWNIHIPSPDCPFKHYTHKLNQPNGNKSFTFKNESKQFDQL